MRDFYERFYRAVAGSPAHAIFCERVFGRNLCQHGFADMAQLDALIAATQLRPGQAGLDLGCGNGLITEYIADRTGAHMTGLDYIPAAIRDAQARIARPDVSGAAAKSDRLAFVVGDINALDLPPAAFDVII
jgi:cyclopropane fatty-acyl-phospholipid synthase-like methyltransferase